MALGRLGLRGKIESRWINSELGDLTRFGVFGAAKQSSNFNGQIAGRQGTRG
jgi:hypothetical protein